VVVRPRGEVTYGPKDVPKCEGPGRGFRGLRANLGKVVPRC